MNKRGHFLWIALITLLLRLPSLFYVFLDVDESQFATAAHVLMDGGQLYKNAVDTKPPLIYFFYQAIFSIFGKYNMTAVHAVSMLIALATALLIYGIGKKIKDEQTGFAAALFFAVFSTTYLPKFIATSITSVMILPLTAAIFSIARCNGWLRQASIPHAAKSGAFASTDMDSRRQDPLHLAYFFAGLLTGIAFLFKYQGGIQLPIIGSFLLYLLYKKEISLRAFISNSGQLLIGFFIPLFLTAFWLHQTGVWDDFVEWSFRGSASYIRSGVETIPFWHNLLLRGGSFILATFLTWILALRVTSHQSQDTTLILLWFLLSLIPVCMGGRFYGHYFIQILPPLCLLAAVGLPALISRRFKTAIAIGMIIPAVVTSVARWNYEKFDSKFPDDQLFQQKKIGEWLKANTQEDETLFVWGFATAIYFHAERKASSRFLWADLLTGKIPGSSLSNQKNFDTAIYSNPKAWEKFWEDMHANPPDYFIDTSSANIHNYGKYHLNQYPLLQSFLQDHYIFLGIRENTNIYKIK